MPNFGQQARAAASRGGELADRWPRSSPPPTRPPTLARCVAALRASSAPPDELVVVESPPGAGPAEARNAGAAEASAELIAFVDADVEVHPDALERARRALRRRPAARRRVRQLRRPARPTRRAVSRFRNLLHHHVHTSSPGPAETFWAGLGAIRRDAFLAAGGFDAARYPEPAIEDIELGMRLVAGGASIVLDPEIRGTHLKRWSLASMVRTDLLRRGIPWVRLQLESGRASGALNLGWRHRLSALAALAAPCRRPRRAGRSAAAAALGGLVGAQRRASTRCCAGGAGIALAAVGLPLHVLHHLVSAIAAVAGGVAHTRSGPRGRGGAR